MYCSRPDRATLSKLAGDTDGCHAWVKRSTSARALAVKRSGRSNTGVDHDTPEDRAELRRIGAGRAAYRREVGVGIVEDRRQHVDGELRAPRLLLKPRGRREDVVRRRRPAAARRAEHHIVPRRIAIAVRIAALRAGRTDKNR